VNILDTICDGYAGRIDNKQQELVVKEFIYASKKISERLFNEVNNYVD